MFTYQKADGETRYLQSIIDVFTYLGNYGKMALNLIPVEAFINANKDKRYECRIIIIFKNNSRIDGDMRKYQSALDFLKNVKGIGVIYDNIANIQHRSIK